MASDLLEAVRSEDPREALEAIRDTLAEAIQDARKADEDKQAQVAALARQLRETLTAIAALPKAKETSTLDELQKRRADRGATSPVSKRAKGPNVSRAGSGGAGGERRAPSRSVAGASPRRGASRGA